MRCRLQVTRPSRASDLTPKQNQQTREFTEIIVAACANRAFRRNFSEQNEFAESRAFPEPLHEKSVAKAHKS